MKKIEIQLQEGAHLVDLIAALKQAIPTLDGHVTFAGENVLTEYYAFNVNGGFYTNEREFVIKPGDRIALLSLATGG